MGARHGTICVLCCWALMAVMFAAGVMSLAAMFALTLATLVEKLIPGPWPSRIVGCVLIAWAALVVAGRIGA
jgi:predicted metal-binding membrane protein